MNEPGKAISILSKYKNHAFGDKGEKVTVWEIIALLKAQEPVEPIENAGFYYCGACKYAFTSARQKYCSDCGRAVKWDG